MSKFSIGQLVEYVGWEEYNMEWDGRIAKVLSYSAPDSVYVEFLDDGETQTFMEYALQRYIPARSWEPKESK